MAGSLQIVLLDVLELRYHIVRKQTVSLILSPPTTDRVAIDACMGKIFSVAPSLTHHWCIVSPNHIPTFGQLCILSRRYTISALHPLFSIQFEVEHLC